MKFKLKNLLNEFEHLVYTNSYEKLSYKMWRELKQFADEEAEARIECDIDFDDVYEIELRIPNKDKIYWFYEDDHSFGSFLYDLIRDEAASISMPVYEYNTMNMNKLVIYQDNKDLWTNSICDIKLDLEPHTINFKENNDMDNKLFKNFDFGVCSNDNIKASFYGLAVKNATGTWVSYDTKTDSVIDVDIINFDGGKYFYKIPVAIKDIKVGDTVIHNRKAVFVKAVEDNRIIAIDPAAGEEKSVLLSRSPFGFDFVTKVVSFLDNICGNASADTPFGNILPLILLSGENKNTNDLLPLLFLSGNTDFASNPLALYALMGSNKSDDILPLLFLANGTTPAFGSAQAPAAK